MHKFADHHGRGRKRSLRCSIALLAATGIIAGTPVAAMADGLPAGQSTVKVNGERADFGSGGHSGGSPAGGANVAFTASPAPGGGYTVSATVKGTLYWGGITGGCARVRVFFNDRNGLKLASWSNNKCGPGITFDTPWGANEPENQRQVTRSYASTELRSVKLCTYEVLGTTETHAKCSPITKSTLT